MGKPTKRSANLQRKGLTADALLAQSYKQCKKRLAASTDRNYKDAQKLWDEYEPSILDIRYCTYTNRPSLLQPGSPVPDVHQLKQFLHCVVSCEVVWARVQSVILQVTGNRVPTQVNTDVLAWIRTNLTQELSLTTERVKKGLCDLVVFTNLMKQLWCHDADEFEWERERVQTAFLLQIHMFTGGRPGAFVPTGYYPDIHLKYEDVEFLLIRVKDGQEKFGLVLRQGWRKGEKQMLDAKLRTLWTEDESMIYCPVTSFLALALADDAFVSIKSRSDLDNVKLDGGEDVRVFPFKAEMHGKPFLLTRRGGTMPYSSWWYKLKSLSQRAGYMEYIRPYDIRRGTANKLDESSSVSTNSRNQLLGHSSDAIYQQYYQSDISAVDIKGIVLRGKADAGFDVQTLRRNRRLKRLPSRLPSREHQEFLANWRRLTWEGEASKDVCGKRARKQAWKALQKSWTETYVTVTAPEPPMQSKIPQSVERFGKLDDPTTLNAIMMQYDPHRKLIKEAALPAEYSLRASPILDSLSCLASQNYEHPAAWYPGTEPRRLTDKRTECRFCRKDLTT
ncbi:hypothetical protein PSV08DRAFT_368862 [Bipolaris maydis]|uniref:uncharacterized protein n=1 Tax=Cochliobolus heterostrophus TaxID=5016 RepID=UPI0024D1FA77|nr:hypothetical protein J3E73DRAFT_387489 [Bipolaris maydis]KAJ6273422.1 hypothetical protein PSV08DRAFT_368862 [Bipolaris maydis]